MITDVVGGYLADDMFGDGASACTNEIGDYLVLHWTHT